MPTDVNKVLKTKSLAAFTLIYIFIVYLIIVNKIIYKWPQSLQSLNYEIRTRLII